MKYAIDFIVFLLCVINFIKKKYITYPKGFFHDQYKIEVLKKIECQGPLTWTRKAIINFNIVSMVLCFCLDFCTCSKFFVKKKNEKSCPQQLYCCGTRALK